MIRTRRISTVRIAAALACALGQAVAGAASAQPAAGEYAVKAAYLYKFAPFVQWPPSVLAPGAPLNLCVVGPDPFGKMLDAAAMGQMVGDHRIEVRRLARVDGRTTCQVMYVRKSAGQSVAEVLAAVHGTPVLTVTDAADGDGARGILHLVVAERRVRFEVDPAEAMESGLAISSKLLDLALPTRPRRTG
jgi:hypothetical protein